jgi:hypothetical protein
MSSMRPACSSRKVIPLFVQGLSQVFHLDAFQEDESVVGEVLIFSENSKVLFQGVR